MKAVSLKRSQDEFENALVAELEEDEPQATPRQATSGRSARRNRVVAARVRIDMSTSLKPMGAEPELDDQRTYGIQWREPTRSNHSRRSLT